MRKLKSQIKDLSNFEIFRLENSRMILGGLGDNHPPTSSGDGNDGGIIDPPTGPTNGGTR